ncbi:MAG TPA: RNB domain-containing ribonuclease [Terriglobales bacterium]
MNATLFEFAVLKKIERQPKHSAGYKQLVRELGLHGDARQGLANLLDRLVKERKLIEVDHRYAIPQPPSNKNLVVGRLNMHRDGFGFVVPDPKSLQEPLKSRLSGDVFIPPPSIGNAMHGDQVLVEVGPLRPDGRAEGRINRPVTRAHETVVGTFHYGSRHNHVAPFDAKIGAEIVIPRGMEVFEQAAVVEEVNLEPGTRKRKKTVHRVLGDEAARRSWDDLEGAVVDVEITEWPTAQQRPRGRVTEILGYEDDFGVDVEIMIRKHHLPHRFPADVLREAEESEAVISMKEARRRRDFRNLPIVTIDGATARDFDDAVTVRRLDHGNFELQVHIADVAHYVTEGSAIDQEARLRGTSVYFPDRAVPMLPLELSTDICSLRPKVDRLVLSCVMEIDNQGEVKGYQIMEGVIRSAERMTYTDVHAILEGDALLRQRYAPLVPQFELMRDLALILNHKRERRGSIDFDLPEPVIEFDEYGLMKSITRSERSIANRLIEEFMLAANESVAQYLENRRIGSIYRIHEKPDAKRVYDFEVIATTFGYSLGVGALPIQRIQFKSDRRASYGTGKRAREIEIPKEVHITPRMYQKLTQKIAGKPEERILSYLMLRSLKQARYSEENLGHFALAAPTYTHFTSPIRRYPDLIVHRILKDVLHDSAESHDSEDAMGGHSGYSSPDFKEPHEKAPSPWSKRRDVAGHRRELEPVLGPIRLDELHDIAEGSSLSERRADEAERELMEWKKVKFMQDRVGEDFDGLIISVTKFGFFVELTDLFVEGLVPLDTLVDDRYVYHESTREIIGQRTRRTYKLGQRIRVIVDRIDPVEKKIQFALLEKRSTPKQQRKKRRR